MQSRLVHESGARRTFVAVLDTGDEAVGSLVDLARAERLAAAQITAIGAFRAAVLAYFNWESKKYEEIKVDDQVEVASFMGDIGQNQDGGPAVHIHAVLGRRDGSAVAGHLLRGEVRPTLEVVVTESPAHLRRVFDPTSGLSLIRLDAR
jgi:predicted DNA-binding protein with PD1-like motif